VSVTRHRRTRAGDWPRDRWNDRLGVANWTLGEDWGRVLTINFLLTPTGKIGFGFSIELPLVRTGESLPGYWSRTNQNATELQYLRIGDNRTPFDSLSASQVDDLTSLLPDRWLEAHPAHRSEDRQRELNAESQRRRQRLSLRCASAKVWVGLFWWQSSKNAYSLASWALDWWRGFCTNDSFVATYLKTVNRVWPRASPRMTPRSPLGHFAPMTNDSNWKENHE